MNTTTESAVVILGAGATIGSGYTLCGRTLPGDRGFFGNPLVQERLSKYPALHAMLGFFRKDGDNLVGVGLEEVWTFLDFSSRDLYRPLTDLANERNEWLQSTDHHLRTLFYQVNHKRAGTKYREVHCCTGAVKGQEGSVFETAKRFFPSERFQSHKQGFEDFVAGT